MLNNLIAPFSKTISPAVSSIDEYNQSNFAAHWGYALPHVVIFCVLTLYSYLEKRRKRISSSVTNSYFMVLLSKGNIKQICQINMLLRGCRIFPKK